MTNKKIQVEEERERNSQEKVIEVFSKERVVSRERRIIIPNKFGDIDLLQGKTLQVYWYLLENKEAGIREIRKALNFSSTGLVAYQINKLVNAGLITKDETTDKYFVSQRIQPGILSFYVKFGTYLIPRVSLYLLIFLLGFIVFVLCSLIFGDNFVTHLGSILFFLLLIIGSIAFSYESTKLNEIKPTYNIKKNDESIK